MTSVRAVRVRRGFARSHSSDVTLKIIKKWSVLLKVPNLGNGTFLSYSVLGCHSGGQMVDL